MFVVRSKKSLSTVFLFFLSRLPFFFVFSLANVFWFSLLLNFFLKNNNNTCEIHSHAIVEKKKKRRVSVVVSVSVVVLSSEESYINAFLFSVVALFRSIDDDEEF